MLDSNTRASPKMIFENIQLFSITICAKCKGRRGETALQVSEGIALKLVFAKAEIESELAARLGSAFKLREKLAVEMLPTGIPEVDRIASGLPRGAITEILGPASSGRTSLLHSALAASTTRQEV